MDMCNNFSTDDGGVQTVSVRTHSICSSSESIVISLFSVHILCFPNSSFVLAALFIITTVTNKIAALNINMIATNCKLRKFWLFVMFDIIPSHMNQEQTNSSLFSTIRVMHVNTVKPRLWSLCKLYKVQIYESTVCCVVLSLLCV